MHWSMPVRGAILLLAGCASASPQWSKPNATSADLQRDAFECELEAEHHARSPTNPFAVRAKADAFDRCMQTKGWTKAE